jgi:hypothetical protein
MEFVGKHSCQMLFAIVPRGTYFYIVFPASSVSQHETKVTFVFVLSIETKI